MGMDKEKRNRVMDLGLNKNNWPWIVVPNEAMTEAIRECDKLTRAWDELYDYAAETDSCGQIKWGYLKERMDKLLSPTPKDPLEELEKWVNKAARLSRSLDRLADHDARIVSVGQLLAEIRRLRGKK